MCGRGVPQGGSLATLTYSQFIEQVRAGQIASVVVMAGNSGAVQAICRRKDGSAERTVLPADYRDALAAMQDESVVVEIRDSASAPVVKAEPFLVLPGVWVILLICKFPNGRSPFASTS